MDFLHVVLNKVLNKTLDSTCASAFLPYCPHAICIKTNYVVLVVQLCDVTAHRSRHVPQQLLYSGYQYNKARDVHSARRLMEAMRPMLILHQCRIAPIRRMGLLCWHYSYVPR